MLTVKLICVGNLKEKHWTEAQEEYVKRLSRFCKLSLIEVDEFKLPQKPSEANILKAKEEESNSILKHVSGHLVLLDVLGQALTSPKLAKKIEEISQVNSTISFVIGGSNGVSDELKQKSNFLLSMSNLTFPHQLARVMFLEQLYRGFTILNNITYHK